MSKHYKLTGRSKTVDGVKVFQIEATEHANSSPDGSWFRKGDQGGWICKETKLSEGSWVGQSCVVIGSVLSNSLVVNRKTKVINSKLTKSRVTDASCITKSCVVESNIVNSQVVNSDLTKSTVHNSQLNGDNNLTNSTVYDSAVDNCSFDHSSVTNVKMVVCDLTTTTICNGYYESDTFDHCYFRVHEKSKLNDLCTIVGARFMQDSTPVEVTDSEHIFLVGPAPSSGRTTVAVWDLLTSEVVVSCGCFSGSVDEFIEQINETHADAPLHKDVYLLYAKTIRKWGKLIKQSIG